MKGSFLAAVTVVEDKIDMRISSHRGRFTLMDKPSPFKKAELDEEHFDAIEQWK